MKTALDQFITGSKELPLGERVFNYATFIGIFMAFSQAIQIVALGFPINQWAPPFLSSAACFLAFYCSRFKGLFSYVTWPLIITNLMSITIQWFQIGGLNSSLPYIYVMALVLFLIILPHNQHKWLLLLYLILFMVLTYIQVYYPDLITPYPRSESFYSDSGLTLGSITIAIVLVLNLLKKEFDRNQQEIKQQNLELIKANEIKTQFLANMSHEIRTPMNGVVGMTELLENTALNTEQTEYVETIRISGERLLTIINEILDFSKVESGEITIEQIPFHLCKCIEDAIAINSPNAQTKGLKIYHELHEDLPESIIGDVGKVHQILLNLIGNAIKFTEEGEIYISAQMQPSQTHDLTLVLSVKDTGIGIPQENITNLFDAFTQADASTTRQYGGTGLGLTICKQLAKAMGGDIMVESAIGQGSIFKVCLPMNKQTGKNEVPSKLKDKHILVVDNDPTNCEILVKHLQQWQCIPLVAHNAVDALALLDNNSIDLALLDFHMAGMDGMQLGHKIKSMGHQFPMILISSGGHPNHSAFNTTFAHFMLKPVRHYQLKELFPNLLEQKKTTTQQPKEKNTKNNLQILVVEDDLINQKLATRILTKWGHKVTVATNGQKALNLLVQHSYDLIFMDIQMPVLDGYQTTEQIAQKYPKHPPIIAMTANAMAGDREKCLAVGMSDYLSKPISSKTVQAIIDKWCKI